MTQKGAIETVETLQAGVSETDSALRYFTKTENKPLRDGVEQLTEQFLHSDNVCSDLSKRELQRLFESIELPEHGVSETQFLKECEQRLLPHSINTGSPRFIGHMTSLLPNFVRQISKLKSTLNQNMVKFETASAVTFWEKQALAMIHRLIYRSDDHSYRDWLQDTQATLGVVTSGGTIANLTALQCARATSMAKLGDVEALGLHVVLQRAQYQRSVILVSELGHYSIKKSMALLGLGKQNLVTVKTDAKQRMDVSALKLVLQHCQDHHIHVCAIVGVAGTTECGSFDPLDKIADLAKRYGCYFHVDAAWGGPLLLSDKYRHLLKGIELADSVTIDGHKQLYLPMGFGMVLFRDPDMPKVIANEANYIIRQDSPDLGRISVEGSRAANVFYLQAGFKLLGKQGYSEILEKNIATAHGIAANILLTDDFQLLTQPQSNIFLYRYLPKRLRGKDYWTEEQTQEINQLNILLQEQQHQRGNSFVSRTKLTQEDQKLVALRIVIANPLTGVEHGLQVLDEQREIMAQFDV